VTILITGASSGIGAALAHAYASPGVRLVLCGRDGSRLEDVARACRRSGAVAQTVRFDLMDVMAMSHQMEMADAEVPIDLIFLNAGLGGSLPPGDTAQDTGAAFEMATVNFTAPVVAANLMANCMARRGAGRIVLIGSVAQAFPLPMAPAYAGTKAGLAMFARALRLRLEGAGVGVTLVVPGFVDTPMSRALSEPRPFLLTAAQAAAIIRRGVASGRREVVLPWPFALINTLAQWLPRAAIDALLRLLWLRSRV
jgi:short-subunit dehydrogenase